MKYSMLMFVFLFLIHSVATAALYRWVDDNGKVHYSDSVPPSKAQSGHTELDANGNRVKKVAPAKSKEQVREEKWLKELEEKLKIKQAQQKRKDALLLGSYTSIEQFDKFYAERVDVLNEERKQLELLRSKLQDELERLLKQHKAGQNTAAKKRVQGFIDINLENAQSYEEAIEQNMKEEKSIRSESEELRKRFLYLKKKEEQAAVTVESDS